jgi:hypothetical protein
MPPTVLDTKLFAPVRRPLMVVRPRKTQDRAAALCPQVAGVEQIDR